MIVVLYNVSLSNVHHHLHFESLCTVGKPRHDDGVISQLTAKQDELDSKHKSKEAYRPPQEFDSWLTAFQHNEKLTLEAIEKYMGAELEDLKETPKRMLDSTQEVSLRSAKTQHLPRQKQFNNKIKN